jgi:hypothetical protein
MPDGVIVEENPSDGGSISITHFVGSGCAMVDGGAAPFLPQATDSSGHLYLQGNTGFGATLDEYDSDGGLIVSTSVDGGLLSFDHLSLSPDGLTAVGVTSDFFSQTTAFTRLTRANPGDAFTVDPTFQPDGAYFTYVTSIAVASTDLTWVSGEVQGCGSDYHLVALGSIGQTLGTFGDSDAFSDQGFCYIQAIALCAGEDVCAADGNCKHISEWHPDGGWVATSRTPNFLLDHLISRPGGGVAYLSSDDFSPSEYGVLGP